MVGQRVRSSLMYSNWQKTYIIRVKAIMQCIAVRMQQEAVVVVHMELGSLIVISAL